MILKSLLFGTLGLASVPNQVTAQYINHLQKYYRFDPSVPDEEARRIFDTKALTPVYSDAYKFPKWTFVTTASGKLNDPDTASDLSMVITRLKANLPLSDAFKFESSKEYVFNDNNNEIKLRNIDVMDIVHARGQGYIACGRVVDVEGISSGFLLRINENLNPVQSRRYREVEVFNSCGFWHKENKGFVAVGSSPTFDPKNVGRQAIFMSVKKNLDQQICGFNVTGTFQVPDDYVIDNRFNKVIKYGKTNKKLHAMVGTTTAYFNDARTCTEDNDVLVMIVNEKCEQETLKVRQFGDKTQSFEVAHDEKGFALTALKEGAPKGLVITGSVRNSNQCQESTNYDDTLVFRLDDNLHKDWWFRYDIYPPVAPKDTPDFGTAIVMNDQQFPVFGSPNGAKEPKNILVAGETNTPFFSNQEGPTGDQLDTKDAFVLELEPQDGTVRKNEFFGLEENAQNGVLRTGGLLDMHLSQDGHAVIMGNALLPEQNDNSPVNPKKPYLIERYDTISDDPDKKCSLRKDIVNQEIHLPEFDVKFEEIKPEPVKFKLKKKGRKWKEKVPCKKEDLEDQSPAESPSESPTESPSETPSETPMADDGVIDDIFPSDDIFIDDFIFKKPTSKPTFPKSDDGIPIDDKFEFEDEDSQLPDVVGSGSF